MSQDKKASRIFSVAALQEVIAKQQEQFGAAKDPNQIGIVLAIDVAKVIEDPDQPRQIFDDEAMDALIEDVKIRGIQSPIAVRPSVDGVFKIIHGARRYRAALAANLPKVPVIVQSDSESFDDYSQIAENTKRAGLHPMDIARFIQKRIDLGEKQKDIAAKLGERPEYIVRHLSLLTAPKNIIAAFHEGRVRGAENVWSLSKLHDKSPEAVERLLELGGDITQKMIRDASSGKAAVDPVSEAPAAEPSNAPIDTTGSTASTDSGGTENIATPTPKKVKPASEPTEPSTFSHQDRTSPTDTSKTPEDSGSDYPDDVSGKPLLIATWENQEVVLVPDEIPSRIGLVWIQNTETEELFEVNAIELTLLRVDYEGSE